MDTQTDTLKLAEPVQFLSWGAPNLPPFSAVRTPINQIMQEVAAKHRITVNDLVSHRRSRHVSWPRQEAYWRAKQETTLSLPAIGAHFGNRDHKTILYGIKAHEARLAVKAGE